MTSIQYKIWSTYPPALYKHGQGTVRIAAGTIDKLMVGSTPIPVTQSLPDTTSVSQFTWMGPDRVATISKPVTVEVPGSKGAVYHVTTYPNGRKTCTCPGYTFRKTCKHL